MFSFTKTKIVGIDALYFIGVESYETTLAYTNKEDAKQYILSLHPEAHSFYFTYIYE